MNKWYQIFHRNTGLSPYVWVVFCILPFYFIWVMYKDYLFKGDKVMMNEYEIFLFHRELDYLNKLQISCTNPTIKIEIINQIQLFRQVLDFDF